MSVNKLSSHKQFRNLYILTTNESEKDQYINMFSELSMKLNTQINNGLIVSRALILNDTLLLLFYFSQKPGTFTTKEIFDISLKKVTGSIVLGNFNVEIQITVDVNLIYF